MSKQILEDGGDMEIGVIAVVIKGVAEFGILGLGWAAWLWTMLYLREERKKNQELVVHIISYFTKVKLAESKVDDSNVTIPAALFGRDVAPGSKRTADRNLDPSDNGTPGGFTIRRRPVSDE